MNLEELRKQIDEIDDRLLELLNRRIGIVQKVGELKHKTGASIYRPEREKAIIRRLMQKNEGPLTEPAIEAIFLEIFAVARNFEQPQRVAYLGRGDSRLPARAAGESVPRGGVEHHPPHRAPPRAGRCQQQFRPG